MADDAVAEARELLACTARGMHLSSRAVDLLTVLADEVERLRAERDAAIEALRPFAYPDRGTLIGGMRYGKTATREAIEKARALVERYGK